MRCSRRDMTQQRRADATAETAISPKRGRMVARNTHEHEERAQRACHRRQRLIDKSAVKADTQAEPAGVTAPSRAPNPSAASTAERPAHRYLQTARLPHGGPDAKQKPAAPTTGRSDRALRLYAIIPGAVKLSPPGSGSVPTLAECVVGTLERQGAITMELIYRQKGRNLDDQVPIAMAAPSLRALERTTRPRQRSCCEGANLNRMRACRSAARSAASGSRNLRRTSRMSIRRTAGRLSIT